MSAKQLIEAAPGQRWAIRDDRYDGWRYVTVESVDSRYVYTRGQRKGQRRSRILRDSFGGGGYTFCGHDGPGILPPYSTHPIGCLNCAEPAETLPMRFRLDPGFGFVEITRDGDVVWGAMETDKILAEFERRARATPGDWRLRKETPMREVLYQRQGPSRWVLVAIGMGFA